MISFSFNLQQEYRQLIRKYYSRANFSVESGKNTLQEVLSNTESDFCIVVNSTAYYECYMFGIPTLRFAHSQFDMSHPLSRDSFSNQEDFRELLKRLYQEFDQHFVSGDINKELDYVLGLSKNEYRKILN